jgi:hypothetical protein
MPVNINGRRARRARRAPAHAQIAHVGIGRAPESCLRACADAIADVLLSTAGRISVAHSSSSSSSSAAVFPHAVAQQRDREELGGPSSQPVCEHTVCDAALQRWSWPAVSTHLQRQHSAPPRINVSGSTRSHRRAMCRAAPAAARRRSAAREGRPERERACYDTARACASRFTCS